MVLQLSDVDDNRIYLGAILAGDEASAFFVGLPPANLRESNASLMALRQRVATLCSPDAPAAEMCLFVSKPQPSRESGATTAAATTHDGARAVAYHIVSTRCLAGL